MNKERTLAFFEGKNRDRQAARKANPHDYRDGRANRRELAIGGAFGQSDGWVYNQCAMGTVGGRTKSDNRED